MKRPAERLCSTVRDCAWQPCSATRRRSEPSSVLQRLAPAQKTRAQAGHKSSYNNGCFRLLPAGVAHCSQSSLFRARASTSKSRRKVWFCGSSVFPYEGARRNLGTPPSTVFAVWSFHWSLFLKDLLYFGPYRVYGDSNLSECCALPHPPRRIGLPALVEPRSELEAHTVYLHFNKHSTLTYV